MLSLHEGFLLCGEPGLVLVQGLLIAEASLVAHRLSSCGAEA